MPSFASTVLPVVFAELERNSGPLESPAAALTPSNPFTDAEHILDQALQQAWLGTGKIKTEDCVWILLSTLRRFEYIQQLVSVQESWNLECTTAQDSIRSATLERDISESEYRPYTFKPPVHRQKCDLHALFVNALPRQKLQQVLSIVLCELGKRMLQLPPGTRVSQKYQQDDEQIPDDPFSAKLYLDKIVERMCDVGLGGPPAERAYAVAADRLLSSFIETDFGDLAVYVGNLKASRTPGQVKQAVFRNCPIIELEGVMIEAFCPVLHAFMWPLESLHENCLGLEQGFVRGSPRRDREAQLSKETRSLGDDKNIVLWCDRARNKLRDIRAKQSYNIIISQDGPLRRCGLLDLRELCKDPFGRNLVAQGLEKQIDKQLVRPGTSTVEVLDTYMLIIGALSEPAFDGLRVDPSNVLLTRSAGPVRSFLRNREDAARIVILSLLEPRPLHVEVRAPDAPLMPPSSSENFSGQIAVAMFFHRNPHGPTTHFDGHDLLDQNWTPEPVDALSGHRFNMSLDAIGHITTIAPPETFVRELEHLLGDRLLKTDQLNFEAEMRLLKIFHARFGETQIQACENMLNDMMESAKWNEKIRSKSTAPQHVSKHEGDFQAKIISQASWQELRWDQIQREHFELPTEMEEMRRSYEDRFCELQDERHLEWVPHLGRVTIDLDFEDRLISEEVTPLQAAVIHQFASSDSRPATRTLEQVKEALQGDELSIRAALQFWVAKVVLQPAPDARDSFSVLETLTAAEEEAAATAAAATYPPDPDSAGMRSRAELLAQHATTYTAYITGMLTNQGAMDVERIHSLLKMLAPGGFAFDVEDLVGLLEGMSGKGQVARSGALWMILQT